MSLNINRDALLPLGFISQKYESGDSGAGEISDVPGDGGGKAYGIFQLDSKHGGLTRYIQNSEFRSELSQYPVATDTFDSVWKSLANKHRLRFEMDQRDFMVVNYYNPALAFAGERGFEVSRRAMQEVVFSIAVQHGGYKVILKDARKISNGKTAEEQIPAIYLARKNYVARLSTLSARVKAALHMRYDREAKDILLLL